MFFTKNKRERFVFIAWRIRDSDDDDNSKLNWLCVYFFFGLDLSFFFIYLHWLWFYVSQIYKIADVLLLNNFFLVRVVCRIIDPCINIFGFFVCILCAFQQLL